MACADPGRALLACTGVLVSSAAASLAEAKRTWYVSAAATSNPTCATASKSLPFATIAAALECAKNGDTVKVGAGSFAGGFTIAANVVLQGAGANETTITNPFQTTPEISTAANSSVTLADLTVNGGRKSDCGSPGIVARGASLVLEKVAVTETSNLEASTGRSRPYQSCRAPAAPA